MITKQRKTPLDAGSCNACDSGHQIVNVFRLSPSDSGGSLEIRLCDACLDELILECHR